MSVDTSRPLTDIEKSWARRRELYGPSGRKPKGAAGSSPKPKIPGVIRETAPRGAAQPKVVPGQVYEAVGMGVVGANAILNQAIPRLFGPGAWTDEDRLTGTEIGALTRALGDEALTNRAVAEWLTKIGRSNVHARLTYVLMSIAVPRLARRGMLPPEVMQALADANANAGAAHVPPAVSAGISPDEPGGFDFGAPDTSPVSVEAGGAPHDDGGHGEREIEPGGVPEPVPDVVPHVSDESRRGFIRGQAHKNGGGVGEPQVSPVGVVAQ